MKKIILLFSFILISIITIGQNKYYTKSGTIDFEASVPSFEEVVAKNDAVTSILNLETGEIASLALIKGFRFKVALMEEHFNENYAESDKFPKATFSGKITDFSFENLTNAPQKFDLIGTLTFHGKSVEINPEMTISLDDDIVNISTVFIVKPEKFDIKIPKLIRKKVAETVKVTINYALIKKS
jgi:hypothetical protein